MKGTAVIEKIAEKYNLSEKDFLQYALGGLMYSPAHNSGIAQMLIQRKYSHLRSLALCLEDAIADGTEELALLQLEKTFSDLNNYVQQNDNAVKDMPYIFVRVKYPQQMQRVFDIVGNNGLLKGFIFPKFSRNDAHEYLGMLSQINSESDHVIYGMPIIESSYAADAAGRLNELTALKSMTDECRELILNIRIGGNDFCSLYGIRRGINETIYDIRVISDIISDIVNIFGKDYVISAPVWEYFSQGKGSSLKWADGLRREASLDILNGLTGKTAIHPSQLPVIDDALSVTADDYNDAVSILNWNDDILAVSKSSSGGRMNEQKVHGNWARKILIRSAVYGVKKEEKPVRRAAVKK